MSVRLNFRYRPYRYQLPERLCGDLTWLAYSHPVVGKEMPVAVFLWGGCDIGLSYFADNALQIYIRRSYAPATIPCAKSKLKRKSQRSSNFSEILVFLYGVQWWLYCQQVYCSLILSPMDIATEVSRNIG